MSRLLAVALLLSVGSLALADDPDEDSLSRIRTHAMLDVAVYDKFPPYSYRGPDGKPAGVDIDIAQALATELGVPARFRLVTADETVSDDLRNNVWKGHYLGGGTADVMMHVPTDNEFAEDERQSILFGTYLHETISVAHRPGRLPSFASPVAIASQKIAVENDSISDFFLSGAFGGQLRTAAVRKPTLNDALLAMLAGEVDAVMGPKQELQGLLAMQSDRNVAFRDQQLAGLLRGSWDIGFAIRKEGGATLRAALENAFVQLRSAGTIDRIFAAHNMTAAPVAAPKQIGDARPAQVLEEVTVASTPLGGLELPIDRIPGNVQRADSKAIEKVRGAGLVKFMEQRLGSVFVNDAQGNLLQPDVQYRGFVASPLLGQPQGMSVYQNGVRINEPFGDVVNWALVPEGAIDRIELIPGSNPVFGLNTLGGALSLRTKNGFEHAGTSAEMLGGSHGRTTIGLQSGGNDDRFSYFASARRLSDDGWRDASPSDARHMYADVGWRDDATSLDLSVTRISTDLACNGPAPVQLLELERDAVYTHPDRTENSLTFVSLAGNQRLSPEAELHGVAYFRRSDIHTINGDESDFEACDDDAEWVCNGDDEIAFDAEGTPIAFDDAGDGATLNRSLTRQETYGATIQVGVTTALAGRSNNLIVGTSADRSNIRFASSTELGSFDESRGVIGSGALIENSFVSLDTRLENVSVFITDTLALSQQLDLTASARYNDTTVELRDRIGTALNGDHAFHRANGALGLSYRPTRTIALYADYSESNRAPSPVELTCADEDAPCALPNSFLSDPPLEQVVARTIETGVRGTWRNVHWHAGVFRTTNENDILFISAGALTNRGFFDNVGDTRRQGIEINARGSAFDERLSWFAHYTQLQATFLDDFTVASPNNPESVGGEIFVLRGARLPGVPERLLKVGASMQLTRALTASVDAMYQSNQFLRGDEGNLTAPLEGFAVLNASAQWTLKDNFTLFVEIENLLDRNYETFGLYGAAGEVLGNKYDDPRFLSPAAPRRALAGFSWKL